MAAKLKKRSQMVEEDGNNNEILFRDDKSGKEEHKYFLQCEIEKLEKEIKSLEDEKDLQERMAVGKFSTDILKRISYEFESAGYLKNQDGIDHSDEKQLCSKVETLEVITGIKFDKCKLEKLDLDNDNVNQISARGDSSSWRRHLAGKCYDLTFSADFVVVESTEEEHSNLPETEDTLEMCKAKLTELNVVVSNLLAARELDSFIKKTETEKSLCPFFQVLMQYGEWFHHRMRTFSHFKSKYPHIVHLISGTENSAVMQFINPVRPSLVFAISWNIIVGDADIVRPEIDIHTHCAKQTGQMRVTKSFPVQFRKMLSIFGIEHAIELVVGVVLGTAS